MCCAQTPKLLPPVAPRASVVYVGENDLAAGAAPETVANDIMALLELRDKLNC